MEKKHADKCEFKRRMTIDVHAQYPKLNERFCNCDGYHTFDELYEHRITLYIALCQLLRRQENAIGTVQQGNGFVWRSKKHSDRELVFGGTWFVLGIGKEKSEQITYHLPIEKWEETNFADTLEIAPEFDGHTSQDVLERLKNL